jgi:hypothetical protein
VPLVDSESRDLTDVQASNVSTQRLRAERSSITHLDADTADIAHSLVEEVQSAHTELVSCNTRHVSSNVTEIKGGFVARLDTGEASADHSNVALLRTGSLTGDHCFEGVVAASGTVTLSGGMTGIIAGRLVRGDRVRALLVLAPRVEGEVTSLMDTRQVILFGVLAGVVLFILRRLLGRS